MNVSVIRADFYGKVTSQYTIHNTLTVLREIFNNLHEPLS